MGGWQERLEGEDVGTQVLTGLSGSNGQVSPS